MPSGWPSRTSSAWSGNRPCSTTPRVDLRVAARAGRSPAGRAQSRRWWPSSVTNGRPSGVRRRVAEGSRSRRRRAGGGPGEADDLDGQGPGGAEAGDQLGGLGDDHDVTGGGQDQLLAEEGAAAALEEAQGGVDLVGAVDGQVEGAVLVQVDQVDAGRPGPGLGPGRGDHRPQRARRPTRWRRAGRSGRTRPGPTRGRWSCPARSGCGRRPPPRPWPGRPGTRSSGDARAGAGRSRGRRASRWCRTRRCGRRSPPARSRGGWPATRARCRGPTGWPCPGTGAWPRRGAGPGSRRSRMRSWWPWENSRARPPDMVSSSSSGRARSAAASHRLAAGAAVAEQVPPGPGGADLGGGHALVLAVVDLEQGRCRSPGGRRTRPAGRWSTALVRGLDRTRSTSRPRRCRPSAPPRPRRPG